MTDQQDHTDPPKLLDEAPDGARFVTINRIVYRGWNYSWVSPSFPGDPFTGWLRGEPEGDRVAASPRGERSGP